MNLDRYEYERKRTYKEYSFFSQGPKGRILKIVRFVLVGYTPTSYNLLLGDYTNDGDIDDLIVTNNGDVEKVLATIAAIILDFTDIFTNARIYAKGSTPARTRLYQIGINRFFNEIIEIFDLYGYIDNQWKPFEKNINYLAFMLHRNESVILKEQTEIYMTSSSKSNKNKIKKRVYHDRTVDGPELVDIDNSPFVLRKMADIRELLKKSPFPEELIKKRK